MGPAWVSGTEASLNPIFRKHSALRDEGMTMRAIDIRWLDQAAEARRPDDRQAAEGLRLR
jgi:hypothetical protein